jgi:hypothetical protein
MSDGVDDHLDEGLHASGYASAEDGLIWETFLGEDAVVQCPEPGEEAMVPRAVFLYSHVGASGARVPGVVDYSETPPAYLAVENVGRVQLAAVRDGDRARELAAVESTGEALGGLHAAEGFGYGEIEGEAYRRGSHPTWRAFAEALVERVLEFTAGGRFEDVARRAADGFEPGAVPETPDSSVLHTDLHGRNVVLDGDDRAWIIDLDNAIYGDSRFDYVRSRRKVAGADGEARAAFRRGYRQARGLEPDEALRDQYVRLSILKGAEDGAWVGRNTGLDTGDWADGLEEWYRGRFG